MWDWVETRVWYVGQFLGVHWSSSAYLAPFFVDHVSCGHGQLAGNYMILMLRARERGTRNPSFCRGGCSAVYFGVVDGVWQFWGPPLQSSDLNQGPVGLVGVMLLPPCSGLSRGLLACLWTQTMAVYHRDRCVDTRLPAKTCTLDVLAPHSASSICLARP